MKKIKITAEQYKNLFVGKINESTDVKGGINRVSKSFKQEVGPLNEDLADPELVKSIYHFIEKVWLNPSQHGLDKFFIEHGISWGDIVSYLSAAGFLSIIGAGVYKINNFFKRAFSKNKDEAAKQKAADIEKMAVMAAKDPKAPWNQNKLKDPNGQQTMTTDEGAEATKQHVKPIYLGRELALLNSPEGTVIFDYSNLDRNEFPNPEYELNIDDVAEYVNENWDKLSKGRGIKAFEGEIDLILLDEPLKQEIIQLYRYDKRFIEVISKLQEVTGAASSGAFSAPMTFNKPQDEEVIDEVTSSASSGAYSQPKIWAKDKASWKPAQKPMYPKGKIVKVGDTIQGGDTKKMSVPMNQVYEQIAKMTGKSVENVKQIIESKLNNVNSLG